MTWSRRFSACRECGTTKRKHKGEGLCEACHSKVNKAKRKREMLEGLVVWPDDPIPDYVKPGASVRHKGYPAIVDGFDTRGQAIIRIQGTTWHVPAMELTL